MGDARAAAAGARRRRRRRAARRPQLAAPIRSRSSARQRPRRDYCSSRGRRPARRALPPRHRRERAQARDALSATSRSRRAARRARRQPGRASSSAAAAAEPSAPRRQPRERAPPPPPEPIKPVGQCERDRGASAARATWGAAALQACGRSRVGEWQAALDGDLVPDDAEDTPNNSGRPIPPPRKGRGQCERHPLCTRGFRHCGHGGKCALRKPLR